MKTKNKMKQREIKFRGKRLDNGRWIVGSYVRYTGADGNERHLIFYANGNPNDVDPKTVGQFTGLKDKRDKEIFEGDVVEGLSLRNFKVKEVVNWDKFQWFPFAGHWGLRDFEVIGNIYSNPELTK